ncbi:MAG: hypothetical protein WDZ85_01300 [Candidatus Paceibacterota bacterium]
MDIEKRAAFTQSFVRQMIEESSKDDLILLKSQVNDPENRSDFRDFIFDLLVAEKDQGGELGLENPQDLIGLEEDIFNLLKERVEASELEA